MKREEMYEKKCPFKAGNCQGTECMAANHNQSEGFYCTLLIAPVSYQAEMESPQIPEGYTIREIKT